MKVAIRNVNENIHKISQSVTFLFTFHCGSAALWMASVVPAVCIRLTWESSDISSNLEVLSTLSERGEGF